MPQSQPAEGGRQIRRLRLETRRRALIVAEARRLTPRMLRVRFESDDLSDFVSPAHDDHVRIFFPSRPGEGEGARTARDFTPRAFDPARKSLVVDFALHDAGPATDWAVSARVGDRLEIGGPRGSQPVPDDFDWYWLIGDETALPAIGRRVEELRAGARVMSAVALADPAERQVWETRAAWTPIWVQRGAGGDDACALRAALDGLDLPGGDGFVWIACEAASARALRAYFIEERGQPKSWIKAAGYWKRGAVDGHERIED